jgi:hypothetical protein
MPIKEARKYVNMDNEYMYDPIQSYLNNVVFTGLQQREINSKTIDKA